MSEENKQIEPSGTFKPALISGGAIGAIVPQDFDAVWRLSMVIGASRMCPKDFDTPEKVAVAIMHGLEVGLSPMAAMQSIAVINGRPSLWGDAVLGLVRASGLLEIFKEEVTGEGDRMKAVCIVKRKGDTEQIISEFTAEDAKRANLWGKSGPWTQYPKRMLKMRARGFALRDGFPDVLRGLHVAEEQRDIEYSEVVELSPPTPEPPAPKQEEQPKRSETKKTKPADKQAEPEPEKEQAQTFGGYETIGNYMSALEDALNLCSDEEALEDIWQEFDPMATFDGDDDTQDIANKIKARAIGRMSPPSPVQPLFSDN